jgi:ribosome-interacting GTPase 1
MIADDQALKATQERIARFQQWLAQMRRTARAEEFEAAAGGYRLEIERMQAEVLDYLLRPPAARPEPQAA